MWWVTAVSVAQQQLSARALNSPGGRLFRTGASPLTALCLLGSSPPLSHLRHTDRIRAVSVTGAAHWDTDTHNNRATTLATHLRSIVRPTVHLVTYRPSALLIMSGSGTEQPAAAPGGPIDLPAKSSDSSSSSQPDCTIFITGEVNSGKSSLLNALSGGLVSNASLQRETFNPIEYQYSQQGTEANLRAVSEQLESVHEQNEELRGKLDTLGEEKVSSTHRVAYPLPVRYDYYSLKPFTLVDFPGINDAEDEEKQLFFTALRNKVSEADLIIFVTDAMTASSKASEIAQFRKIQQLVKQENDCGHFLELIVVVNKFDTTDDKDLCDIYSRIPDKLADFSKERVFRFSSHKMLIDNVLRCELDLYLPSFNRAELQRVLKTCNVQLSTAAQKRIKKEGLLRYSDINVQPDLTHWQATSDEDSDEDGDNASRRKQESAETEEETYVDVSDPLDTAPYYQFVQHLSGFQTRLSRSRVDSAMSHLKEMWSEMTRLCSLHTCTAAEVRPALSSLIALVQRFDHLGEVAVYHEQFLQGLSSIGALHTAGPTRLHTAGDVVKVLLVFAVTSLTARETPPSLVVHMQTDCKRFAIDIHHNFAQYFIVCLPKQRSLIVKWNAASRDWLVHFASDERTFTQSEWKTFCLPSLDESARGVLIDLDPNAMNADKKWTRLSPNPVLQNLLHTPHVPVQMRMLLRLAVTPLVYLNEIDRSQRLPYELLEETLPGVVRSLRLLMLQPALFDPSKPLLHRLFNLHKHFPTLASHTAFLSEWDVLASELKAQSSSSTRSM